MSKSNVRDKPTCRARKSWPSPVGPPSLISESKTPVSIHRNGDGVSAAAKPAPGGPWAHRDALRMVKAIGSGGYVITLLTVTLLKELITS